MSKHPTTNQLFKFQVKDIVIRGLVKYEITGRYTNADSGELEYGMYCIPAKDNSILPAEKVHAQFKLASSK